jgi:hypothetical protein
MREESESQRIDPQALAGAADKLEGKAVSEASRLHHPLPRSGRGLGAGSSAAH